ncbi:monovalent cation/H(+) antiporter subunit G [Nocardioides yefusunii]|uniref:Monovalent cation/H(+) antiporter subunit G n=1 Tax=Nocardioides yefusunii TaxID=2500546 RepID=A0ABW1QU59_9ACTN|nr:monovalent cation/H(+) antiporter subunit G [Nocardioides yefusunii]
MTWTDVADVAAAALLLAGSAFALIAAIGVVRLPDLPTRMHAATKPQVIGLMLVVCGLALKLREPSVLGLLFLVVMMQMATAVVSGHMVARAGSRAGLVRDDLLVVDELTHEPDAPDGPELRGAP